MRLIFPLFIIVPILEMLLLIQVGGLIGAIPTIGLVLLTAVIGLQLLRQQGLSTLMRANQKLASGEMPAEEVVEGIMLAVGGALLLTPGFFTDVLGFLCLLPYSRRAMAQRLIAKGLLKAVHSDGFSQGRGSDHSNFGFQYRDSPQRRPPHADQGDIIDGEATPVKDDQLLK